MMKGAWISGKPTWRDVEQSLRLRYLGGERFKVRFFPGGKIGVGLWETTVELSVKLAAAVRCKGCCEGQALDFSASLEGMISKEFIVGGGLTLTVFNLLWNYPSTTIDIIDLAVTRTRIKETFNDTVDQMDLDRLCSAVAELRFSGKR